MDKLFCAKCDNMLVTKIEIVDNLFADIDKYVDLNLSNKKYDNSNIDIKWIDNYSSTNVQIGITASVAQYVKKSETFS